MKALHSLLAIASMMGASALAADPIPLRAGPLSMVFEPDNAFLRYIQLGPDEVLRGITAPVRDQFWATIKPEVGVLSLDKQSDQFTLKFEVVCKEREIDFLWHGVITGNAEGKVEYSFDGEARSTFKRNRIGFCILHGETAAGRPWLLKTTAGEKASGRFPEFIAPHQPAKDLRGIAHEFAKGRWARLDFEGEIFEMEDQRNWTDASFKTYCTPLALPWGVEVKKGTKIQQKITLHLEGNFPKSSDATSDDQKVSLTVTQMETALPGLGLQVSNEVGELSPTEIQRLKELRLDHLRVDLTPADAAFPERLRLAASQAKALDVKLIAAVHMGKNPADELKTLGAELDAVKPEISHWLVNPAADPKSDADPKGPVMARDFLKARKGKALLGFGHATNFTELNRDRPDRQGLELASYGLNPEVHAIDYASMIETLPIQADTVRSARQFVGQTPLIISPITLKVQLVNQKPLPGELPSNVDPRQTSLFAAGWTLGSLRSLAVEGVDRITYYETVGMKGLMAAEQASQSAAFPAAPGQLYPLYHLLKAVGDYAGGQVMRVDSSKPSAVVGLALRKGDHRGLLVANLSDKPRTVALSGFDGKAAPRFLTTDKAWSESSSATEAITLPPRSLVKLER